MSFRKSVLIDSTRWRLHTFLWGVKTLPWARSVLHCEINPEGCRYFPEVYHAAFPCEKNKNYSNKKKKTHNKDKLHTFTSKWNKRFKNHIFKGVREKRGVAYIFKNSISFFLQRWDCDVTLSDAIIYLFFIAFLLFISAYSFIFYFFFLLPSICLQQTRSRRWLTVTSPATTNIWTKLLFTQTASRVNLKSKQSAPSKKKFCSLIAVWEERR